MPERTPVQPLTVKVDSRTLRLVLVVLRALRVDFLTLLGRVWAFIEVHLLPIHQNGLPPVTLKSLTNELVGGLVRSRQRHHRCHDS